MKKPKRKLWFPPRRSRRSGAKSVCVVRFQPVLLRGSADRAHTAALSAIKRLTRECGNFARLKEQAERELNTLARCAQRHQRQELRTNPVVASPPPAPEVENPDPRTFAIDHAGTLWHWNMGWFPSTHDGMLKYPHKPRLGHATFRRSVKLLDRSTPRFKEVLLGVDRPGMLWRRWVRGFKYDHQLYGLVEIRATDGVHAIVDTPEDGRQTVMFANLTERKPAPEPRKPAQPKKQAKPQQSIRDKYMGMLTMLDKI